MLKETRKLLYFCNVQVKFSTSEQYNWYFFVSHNYYFAKIIAKLLYGSYKILLYHIIMIFIYQYYNDHINWTIDTHLYSPNTPYTSIYRCLICYVIHPSCLNVAYYYNLDIYVTKCQMRHICLLTWRYILVAWQFNLGGRFNTEGPFNFVMYVMILK